MKKKVFFLHIPKCAGQSIAKALSAEFDDQSRVLQIWDPELGAEMGTEEFVAAEPEVLAHYGLIWGHLPFPHFRDKMGRESTRHQWYVFTTVREPFERAVSEYLYIRRTPIHPMHQYCSEHSLADYLQDEFCDNSQCQYICGKAEFPAARLELETFFDAFSPVEAVYGLWSEISNEFEISDVARLPALNRSEAEEKPVLEHQQLSAFYHRNVPDLRLYWWVKNQRVGVADLVGSSSGVAPGS